MDARSLPIGTRIVLFRDGGPAVCPNCGGEYLLEKIAQHPELLFRREGQGVITLDMKVNGITRVVFERVCCLKKDGTRSIVDISLRNPYVIRGPM